MPGRTREYRRRCRASGQCCRVNRGMHHQCPSTPPCSRIQGTQVGVVDVRSQSVISLVQDLRPCLASQEEKLAWHTVVHWFFRCQEAMDGTSGPPLHRVLSSGEATELQGCNRGGSSVAVPVATGHSIPSIVTFRHCPPHGHAGPPLRGARHGRPQPPERHGLRHQPGPARDPAALHRALPSLRGVGRAGGTPGEPAAACCACMQGCECAFALSIKPASCRQRGTWRCCGSGSGSGAPGAATTRVATSGAPPLRTGSSIRHARWPKTSSVLQSSR